MRKSPTLRWALMVGLVCLSDGCATMNYAEDVEPVLAQRLVGLRAGVLFEMYGQPTRSEIQMGHHVYYWDSETAYAYTPQYAATTQGYIGNVPYSGTTTMAGPMEAGVIHCVLGAGTGIDSDTIVKIQVHGARCEAFLRH